MILPQSLYVSFICQLSEPLKPEVREPEEATKLPEKQKEKDSDSDSDDDSDMVSLTQPLKVVFPKPA